MHDEPRVEIRANTSCPECIYLVLLGELLTRGLQVDMANVENHLAEIDPAINQSQSIQLAAARAIIELSKQVKKDLELIGEL